MKKIFITLLFISFIITINAQETSAQEVKKEKLDSVLKELADNSCKCIDSIPGNNKTKKMMSKAISSCIDKKVGTYQIMSQLMKVDLDTNENEETKEINITIIENKESKQYKSYYYEIERYLMDNCDAIKTKIALSDSNDEALSSNEKALEYYFKAIEATKKKDYKKAIKLYKKAVKKDPKFTYAWDNMGICYRRIEKYDKAIEAYKESLKINPKGNMPLQNIPVAYIFQKKFKLAIEAYKKLGEINPNNPEVFFGIGRCYANLNKLEKSLDNLCKAYNIYTEQQSPYRTDAEKMINYVFVKLKKQGKEDTFNDILKKNHISVTEEKE